MIARVIRGLAVRRMSSQTVYNAAVSGVLLQGGPAVDTKSGLCRYHTGSRRCAAGWVFHAMGVEPIEGCSVDEICRVYGVKLSRKARSVLITLQSTHDTVGTIPHGNLIQRLAAGFRNVGIYYKLDTSIIDEEFSRATK